MKNGIASLKNLIMPARNFSVWTHCAWWENSVHLGRISLFQYFFIFKFHTWLAFLGLWGPLGEPRVPIYSSTRQPERFSIFLKCSYLSKVQKQYVFHSCYFNHKNTVKADSNWHFLDCLFLLVFHSSAYIFVFLHFCPSQYIIVWVQTMEKVLLQKYFWPRVAFLSVISWIVTSARQPRHSFVLPLSPIYCRRLRKIENKAQHMALLSALLAWRAFACA